MRLWSLHPKHLDAKGLVALWREGLLAQAVLANKTKGYKNHPQLERFKSKRDPVFAIGVYLHHVCNEADKRGYEFNRKKILKGHAQITVQVITVTRGQLKYELEHLLQKLKQRDRAKHDEVVQVRFPRAHPSFGVTSGGVETWERV